ncbi:MAG: hypothetical protein U0790_05370, partial [Isosphaeraceae bacterium]
MDRSARSLMILAALLGPAGRSTPAAAETPVPSASATDAPRTTRRSPAPHDAEGLIGRPTGGGSIESLPSTVSPAIERLVRQGIPPAHTPVPAPMTARRSPSFDEPVAPRPARALGGGDSGGRLDSPRGRPTAPGTSPLALEVTIKPAPFEPEDRRFP